MSYPTEPAFVAVVFTLIMIFLVLCAVTESVMRDARKRDAEFRKTINWIRKN